MNSPTYSQTGLAAFLTGYLGRRVTRQAIHSRLTRGTLAPGTAAAPDAPIRWTHAEVEDIASAWDTRAPSGHRRKGRVPGSTRWEAERRRLERAARKAETAPA